MRPCLRALDSSSISSLLKEFGKMFVPDLILVVEDQEPDQFIANRNLSRQWPDVNIVTVSDGEEAIEYLESGLEMLPDLILLDINMPRMDGHAFLAEWSKLHNTNIPVVIMLTSSEQESDKKSSMGYHCVKDYLLKPLNKKTVQSLDAILSEINP